VHPFIKPQLTLGRHVGLQKLVPVQPFDRSLLAKPTSNGKRMKKNSKLGFGLIANSVDEAQPLLYRITVASASGVAPSRSTSAKRKMVQSVHSSDTTPMYVTCSKGSDRLIEKDFALFTTTCELHTMQGTKSVSSLSGTWTFRLKIS
jgi:hypothetical protein